jgi:hypothetical protein
VADKWEYQTLEVFPPSPQAVQNTAVKFGAEGWELCGMITAEKDFSAGMILKGIDVPPPQPVIIMTFKRRLDETRPAAP